MKLRDYDLFTRLIRTRPLMLAAVLYLIGCILGYVLGFPPFIYGVALFLVLSAAICVRKHASRFVSSTLVIAMLPLGMLVFEHSWRNTEPFDDQRSVLLSGRICELPQWNPDSERTICVLEDLQFNHTSQHGKLRLYLRGNTDLLQAVELGQYIECDAHIWRAETATNPGEFNFSNYLRINGLRGYATATIESAHLSEPVRRFPDHTRLLRGAIGKRIDRLFPKNTAIAKAFLIGERSGLSSEERQAYSSSGAAHLLAISGMHISILAGLFSYLAGIFLRRKHAYLLTLLLLFAYGSLIGFAPSLLRAILMYAVLGAAPLVGRYSDIPTRLAVALLISLLIRPCAILESSFVLSYGATAGIIFLYNPMIRLLHAEDFINKHTNVGIFRGGFKGFVSKIVTSFAVTAAAQLAILPAVVHYFGSQSLWSFMVNLIAAPLAMFSYVLSIFAALLNFVPLAAVADFLFGLLTRFVSFFGNLPISTLQIARFPLWLLILYIITIVLSCDLIRLDKNKRSLLLLLALVAIPISNICSYIGTLGCSIVFLDAGQADCSVVRTEGKVYLIDTGDNYSPAADYLSCMNYDLEGVFLSHCHTDHAEGLAEILDVCTPKRIYISENWDCFEVDESVQLALEACIERGTELKSVSAGDEIQLSGKTLLQVLSPTAGISTDSANDDSLILRIKYGEATAVFCGDAPTSVSSGLIGDVDLLKVSHHGAADSINAQLLHELSPSVAVIPVGYNNFGHPSQFVLDELNAAGAHVCRTDENGAITCRLKEDGSIAVQVYQTSEE